MALYRHVHRVLSVPEGTAEDQTSSSYVVVPWDGERGEAAAEWAVFVQLSQTGGEGTPGVEVQLETSPDGSSWLVTGTPVTLNGDGETHQMQALEALGPYVRARTVLTGTVKPTHTAGLQLASTAPFQLKKVSSSASTATSSGSSSNESSSGNGDAGTTSTPDPGTGASSTSTPSAGASSTSTPAAGPSSTSTASPEAGGSSTGTPAAGASSTGASMLPETSTTPPEPAIPSAAVLEPSSPMAE